jgi:hypothetical protein
VLVEEPFRTSAFASGLRSVSEASTSSSAPCVLKKSCRSRSSASARALLEKLSSPASGSLSAIRQSARSTSLASISSRGKPDATSSRSPKSLSSARLLLRFAPSRLMDLISTDGCFISRSTSLACACLAFCAFTASDSVSSDDGDEEPSSSGTSPCVCLLLLFMLVFRSSPMLSPLSLSECCFRSAPSGKADSAFFMSDWTSPSSAPSISPLSSSFSPSTASSSSTCELSASVARDLASGSETWRTVVVDELIRSEDEDKLLSLLC